MDLAVIILAMTSMSILIHNAYWSYRDREITTYYGVFSGLYTVSAAISVVYGFPGDLVIPIAFAIIGVG
ncbi:MAG: hypothetical protein DRN12_04600 [Thermoplasmata archaeon]|nr:MAG: hypothetical protein DRN12_04600 [Thermoplasmata archaeon]HEC89515.1 hypothetical protein [Thermoplasmatales archaeon]